MKQAETWVKVLNQKLVVIWMMRKVYGAKLTRKSNEFQECTVQDAQHH
jgi:hypothetical protein